MVTSDGGKGDGGSMAKLFAAHDWEAGPLGPRSGWPIALKISVETMLASLHPMCLIWGPERILLYNDGYAPILGARHPDALGRPTPEVWPELWDDLKPLVDGTFAGQSVAFHDQPLTMTRHGFSEQTWYDFAYSPVRDETGQVVGLLNVTSDSTSRVMAERDRDLAADRLAANEAKWRGLFEDLQEGFVLGEVVRDAAGVVTDFRYEEVNNAWYDLLGVERGSVVGRTLLEVFPGVEDEWLREIAGVVNTGEAVRFTRQFNDLQRWYDGICQPAGNDRFTMLFVEVTHRVQADQRREALAELGRELLAASNADEAVRVSVAIIGRALHVGRVGYGTLDDDGETINVPSEWTSDGYLSLVGSHRLDAFGGYADDLRRGLTVAIPDVRLDPRTSADTAPLEKISVRSMVNHPIVEGNGTVAILYVNDNRPRGWKSDELTFIADAAERIRTALARRRAEEESRNSAAFMSSVLAASTDCIKVLELDGTLAFMSEGGMGVMEISDFNAVKGCPWPDFLKADGPGYARKALEAARRGETTHFESPANTFLGTPKHWSVSVSPIPGPQGEVARILSVSRDHTELQKAREQQRLLNAELSHRIKNTLSVVQAIAQQTLGKFGDHEAVASFGKRLLALASAHEVLTQESWTQANFGDVARGALATFGEDRFRLSGPHVTIGPRATLALSLMLHELATNALKYGALSVPAGQVEVTWSVDQEDGREVLALLWTERGGPPAVEPTRKSFGSRIINMGLGSSGSVETRYEEHGILVRATAPLEELQTD